MTIAYVSEAARILSESYFGRDSHPDAMDDRATATERSLSGIRALESLAPAAREALGRVVRWHEYRRNQFVIGHQDESTDVFFIASGSVRVTIYSPAGRQVTFRDMGAGDMFGELAAIDGKPRSATIVALSECLIASMSAQQFWRMLLDYPDFATSTLKRLADMVRTLSERVFEVSVLSVRNRIHAELLRLARAHSVDSNRAAITPVPTHTEIANRISTQREVVAREFSELTKSGLLERKGNTIFVHDIERLARMVEDVLGQDV